MAAQTLSSSKARAAGALTASIVLVALAVANPASAAYCPTPQWCLDPGPQTTNFGPGVTRTSSARYQPISIWNMGGGNFDIAFTLPLLPAAVTYPTNAAPINFRNTINAANAPWGVYGGAAAGWTFVNGGALPNGALTITADQVYAGPGYVGIYYKGNTRGFAVKVNSPMGMPVGNYHWVQVLADNFNITTNPGYGNLENVLDVGNNVTTPYYDTGGAANASAFYDLSSRTNPGVLTQNDWWIADLFLATGPGAPRMNGVPPGQVTLYNTGIQYGWANLHVSVGPLINYIPALRRAFNQDTSSITAFDDAMDCGSDCTELDDAISQSYLSQLDSAFNSSVPEPGSWALYMTGAALAGAALRRRAARVRGSANSSERRAA
ncbi:MAG: hypothetical protein JO111_15675 [Caulobacteraceae bacterium]|nr:hypothetical protein [Caulobacteraceae bacterium]